MLAQSLTCGRARCDAPAVAANSATGNSSPNLRRTTRPTSMKGAFFMPAIWRDASRSLYGGLCVGARKGCRSVGRSATRVQSATFDSSAVAGSKPYGDRIMNTRTPAATAASTNVPRPQWPGLLQHAAMALEGRAIFDSESLAAELRAIAAALRAEVTA